MDELKQLIRLYERRLRDTEELYKSVLGDLVHSFSRPGGPSWACSDSETKWREYRAQVEVYREVLSDLKSIQSTGT